jgi:hypothetical protein
LYLQVLKADHLVFVNQPCGQFVQKILTAIGHLFMQTGHLDTGLAVVALEDLKIRNMTRSAKGTVKSLAATSRQKQG